MRDVLADVRQSIRSLSRTPGFTITALLALTLGIGANSASFSVVNAVLLRPVPYPDAGRLVVLGYTFDGSPVHLSSPAKFVVWRKHHRAFEHTSAVRFRDINRTDGPQPERLSSGYVSADFFTLLGARFAMGRPFTRDEDRPTGARVVILAHREWNERFGGDRNVLGRTVSLDGHPFEIVGVLASDFDTSIFNVSPRVWLPIQIDPATADHPPSLRVIARLRPRVSLERARQEAGAASNEFRSVFPNAMNGNDTLLVEPFGQVLVDSVRPSLLVLSAAVALLLLIACANVANLMLVRAAVRRREIAIRTAMGASRGRIARELFTDSLLLAAAAGIIGVAVGVVGSQGLVTLYPGVIPRIGPHAAGIGVDWRVLTFTMLTSIATAIAFGVFPSIQATRTDVVQALTEGSSRPGVGRSARRVRSILVAAEMVLASVLLVGAGLLIRTLVAMHTVDRGFDTGHMLIMRTSLAGQPFARTFSAMQVVSDGIQRLQAVPGVVSAAATCCVPFESDWRTSLALVGRPSGRTPPPIVSYRVVSGNYFDALGIQLVKGRAFSVHDNEATRPVAIINQAMADRFWSHLDPFRDRVVTFPGHVREDEPERQIVGIVRNVRDGEPLDQVWQPTIYVPLAQLLDRETAILFRDTPLVWIARTRLPPQSVAASAARELRRSTGSLAAARVQTADDLLARSAAPTSFSTVLLVLFGGSALLLSVTGVYGVTAYAVQQRTREIGVRVALGAAPRRVLTMVLLQGLKVVVCSVATGWVAAIGLSHLLEGTFLGVSTHQPLVFAGAPVVLVCAATAAVWLPARRASRFNPMDAIRD